MSHRLHILSMYTTKQSCLLLHDYTALLLCTNVFIRRYREDEHYICTYIHMRQRIYILGLQASIVQGL